MSSFFGQFLLENGIISTAQLTAALKTMASTNRTIGELAVAEGLIDKQTAIAINFEQRFSDYLFGELAVQKGLITRQQVQMLLQKQKKENIRVGEALVKLGYMTEKRVQTVIIQFQEQQQSNRAKALMDDVKNPEIVEFMVGIMPKLVQRMAQIPVKIGNAIPWRRIAQFDIQATLGVSGEISVETSLDLSRALTEGFAERLLNLKPEEIEDDILADVPAELLNVMCGQLKSKFIRVYPSLKIGLPKHAFVVQGGIAFSLVTPDGQGNLIISEDIGPKTDDQGDEKKIQSEARFES